MAFRLDVDHTNKIIMLTIDGELTDQTLLAGYTALASCFEHYGASDCIVDYTGLTKVQSQLRVLGVGLLDGPSFRWIASCLTLLPTT
jgi:hypothetical protein